MQRGRGPEVPRNSFGISECDSELIREEVKTLLTKKNSLNMSDLEVSCSKLYDMVEDLQLQNRDQNAMFLQLVTAVEERVAARIHAVKQEVTELMTVNEDAPKNRRNGRQSHTNRGSLEPRRSFDQGLRHHRSSSKSGSTSAMNIFPIVETEQTPPHH